MSDDEQNGDIVPLDSNIDIFLRAIPAVRRSLKAADLIFRRKANHEAEFSGLFIPPYG